MCVRVDQVWNRVSKCRRGQSFGSFEFVYVRTEFWDRVGVFTCRQSLGSCE